MCIFCTPDAPFSPLHLTDAEALTVERCPNLASRVPVSIVTGFLGAGKTTLINWLLKGSHGKNFCVLQNEFGAVPVDDALIVRSEKFADVAVVTMPTGCVCCKVRGDLVEGLVALAKGAVLPDGQQQHFDAVIVETSGLSEAGPVAQTFFGDRFVQRNFRLDAVIAVVDAQTAPAALRLARRAHSAEDALDGAATEDEASSDEDSDNISGAEDDEETAEEPEAPPLHDKTLELRAAKLLCEQLCLADVILLNKVDLISEEEAAEAASLVSGVNSTARLVRCQHAQPDLESVLDLRAFSLERAMSIDDHFFLEAPEEICPAPGAAAFAFAQPSPSRRPAAPAVVDPSHLHADFASVGLQSSADLDELTFSDWIEGVLKAHRRRLYRAKGVLFFSGVEEPTALQCVGGHIESERMALSDVPAEVASRRRSRLVFIGRTKGIERELTEGFRACGL